jgi:hypothetical protein
VRRRLGGAAAKWQFADAGRRRLGHGLHAAEAATAASSAFVTGDDAPSGPMLERLHDALRATRGAAAAVLTVTPRCERQCLPASETSARRL